MSEDNIIKITRLEEQMKGIEKKIDEEFSSLKEDIDKKYEKIFKNNPFAKKWKKKLAKFTILILLIWSIINLTVILGGEPTFVETPQEYQK